MAASSLRLRARTSTDVDAGPPEPEGIVAENGFSRMARQDSDLSDLNAKGCIQLSSGDARGMASEESEPGVRRKWLAEQRTNVLEGDDHRNLRGHVSGQVGEQL